MLSSIICCAILSAALFGPNAWPPVIILSGLVFVLYSRNEQFEWVDTSNMHTFTTGWIVRLIVEYPVTADPEVYSRLNRELGMRFSRRADLVSAELRKYKFNSRYFVELPLCNYPVVRKFLIRRGVYQHIRDAASCLGLLRGTMMAEHRHRYATRRGWPVQSARLVGCVDESLPESGTSDTARSTVLNLHGPLSFIVCTVCHPVQCPADFTADTVDASADIAECGAQMYASWVAWTTGILQVWNTGGDGGDSDSDNNNDTDEYAMKVEQLATEYAQLGDDDVAHCNALGAVVHAIHDSAAHIGVHRVLTICVAVYMPPVLLLAYLAACII